MFTFILLSVKRKIKAQLLNSIIRSVSNVYLYTIYAMDLYYFVFKAYR